LTDGPGNHWLSGDDYHNYDFGPGWSKDSMTDGNIAHELFTPVGQLHKARHVRQGEDLTIIVGPRRAPGGEKDASDTSP
jgi:hypothetical protein